MPITVNKPVHTALHRREADGSATPLHPGTCAEMVAYVNAAQEAAFGGSNASEALDEAETLADVSPHPASSTRRPRT